jgi:hypothetical protein
MTFRAVTLLASMRELGVWRVPDGTVYGFCDVHYADGVVYVTQLPSPEPYSIDIVLIIVGRGRQTKNAPGVDRAVCE